MIGKETFTPISSSYIDALEYDYDVDNLQVTFTDGQTYTYFNVPPSEWRRLCSSPSVGSYFRARIRDRYAFA